MKLLGSLVCCWRGHLRGKLLEFNGNVRTFGCPRCHATWTRKVSKPKARTDIQHIAEQTKGAMERLAKK